MDLDIVTKKLQLSVDLVNKWGESDLPDGRKFSSLFTYDSISFWDTIAVAMALYRVPKALFFNKQTPFFLQRIATHLRRGKEEIINRKFCLKKNKCSDWPKERTALFLGFQPYLYRDTLYPVVRQMADEKGICSVSLYDYLPLHKYNQGADGIEFQSICQHWDNDVKAYAEKLSCLLKTSINELRQMKVLPQIIQSHGKSVWLQMRETFDWLFILCLPYLIKHLAVARHILGCHKPEVIVSPDVSDPRNRLYCLLGKVLNIPTLEVQFGVYGQESVEWQFFIADRLAVWGETSQRTLIAQGVPAEKITLSGSPRHDSMVSISGIEVSQTRSQLPMAPGATMILFASQYLSVYDQIEDPSVIVSVKRAIFKAADQNSRICLVVKPHPIEKVSALKKLAQGYRNILFVDKDLDIKKLIRACDVFMSLGSTSTMDAIIANKLTICPNFPGWIWSELFINSGAVLVPKTYDELLGCLKNTSNGERKKILDNLESARQNFLQQWIFKADGQSSTRVKSLLMSMVEKRQQPVR